MAEVSAFPIEKAERVAGLVEVHHHDVDITDVNLGMPAVVADIGRDMPLHGRIVGGVPPRVFVVVGEDDARGVSWRSAVVPAVHVAIPCCPWP